MLKSLLLPSWLHSGGTFLLKSSEPGPGRAFLEKARSELGRGSPRAPRPGAPPPARPPRPERAPRPAARGAHVQPTAAQVRSRPRGSPTPPPPSPGPGDRSGEGVLVATLP